MDRYICVHGHFYQPPRENPWLEAIEVQDSAYPFHDWNERITAECYGPNAASRILDGDGRITRIVNNYSRISFNFGPTLLAWLASERPEIYRAVLAADTESRERFSGHGSALAQAYNHMILPLASARDRATQVAWGLRDFEHRFSRPAEGMWLPETAVDLDTLEVLADQGVAFTVLAPHQVARVRPLDGGVWTDVSGGRVDPTRPYLVRLPSGSTIVAFFYDGPISRAVAFEGLLNRGEALAERLVGAFSDERTWPQLVHIATDGETYGHHHRHGDMALAYALHTIEARRGVRLTNYGEYLEHHPPTHEVEIIEDTSWSCAHGIERWRADCGCSSGMNMGWSQAWRGPLRDALDWLRDAVAAPFEERGAELLKDPWAARDAYVEVVLDRSPETLGRFLAAQAAAPLDDAETVRVLKLLELQRHAMLMYTSCGWFFDDLSGIETVQVIQYAGRVVQLAREVLGAELEEPFLERLAEARSNLEEQGNGRDIFERTVKPATVDLAKVGAHYALSSLFEDYAGRQEVFCYTVEQGGWRSWEAGRARLGLGHAVITSEITLESADLSFGVLHFGDHNITGGVRPFAGEKSFAAMVADVTEAFSRADFPETLRRLDAHVGGPFYSLRSLFRDEQRKILDSVLESSREDVATAYRRIYRQNTPLVRFLSDLGAPVPRAFQAAAALVLELDVNAALEEDEPDLGRVVELVQDAATWQVTLERAGLGFALEGTVNRLMEEARSAPEPERLRRAAASVSLIRGLPFDVNWWRAENVFYMMLESAYPGYRARAKSGAEAAREWVAAFVALGEVLRVRVPYG